jgi:hypothetical protein
VIEHTPFKIENNDVEEVAAVVGGVRHQVAEMNFKADFPAEAYIRTLTSFNRRDDIWYGSDLWKNYSTYFAFNPTVGRLGSPEQLFSDPVSFFVELKFRSWGIGDSNLSCFVLYSYMNSLVTDHRRHSVSCKY